MVSDFRCEVGDGTVLPQFILRGVSRHTNGIGVVDERCVVGTVPRSCHGL